MFMLWLGESPDETGCKSNDGLNSAVQARTDDNMVVPALWLFPFPVLDQAYPHLDYLQFRVLRDSISEDSSQNFPRLDGTLSVIISQC